MFTYKNKQLISNHQNNQTYNKTKIKEKNKKMIQI